MLPSPWGKHPKIKKIGKLQYQNFVEGYLCGNYEPISKTNSEMCLSNE